MMIFVWDNYVSGVRVYEGERLQQADICTISRLQNCLFMLRVENWKLKQTPYSDDI